MAVVFTGASLCRSIIAYQPDFVQICNTFFIIFPDCQDMIASILIFIARYLLTGQSSTQNLSSMGGGYALNGHTVHR